MGGETISGCVTVDATKASQIGKKIIKTPVIMKPCVSQDFFASTWGVLRVLIHLKLKGMFITVENCFRRGKKQEKGERKKSPTALYERGFDK